MIRKMLLLESADYSLKTKHYTGLPPELTEGIDQRTLLPKAKVLVIEETGEGFFLFRYTETGEFKVNSGDTILIS